MGLKGNIIKAALANRLRQIDWVRQNPLAVQERMFRERVSSGALTQFAHEWGITGAMTPEEFAQRVPVFDYERFKPYIERMLLGERDVASRGRVRRFARSSGTTSDRSKYIPVTWESVVQNHSLGMRDVAALYLETHPTRNLLDGEILTLGGSCEVENGALIGDLSAVIYRSTLPWNQLTCTPGAKIALEKDFDKKCELICRYCSKMDIRSFAGVPSWNLSLMRRVVEYNNKRNLLEVWPRLGCFAHGGVSFAPYRSAFEELIPSPDMCYMETYNASEGFFAIADDPTKDDMLLMLDYGTYLEFRQDNEIVPLEGVKRGESYALIITSNNGLWRYEIGDVVTFTSTDPYRICFAGRTKQFINVFGEELMVDNVEQALADVCRELDVQIEEYSVAPKFMTLESRGSHQWVVEFRVPPISAEEFSSKLDKRLRELNSDYDAKRQSTLQMLELVTLEPGTFLGWLKRTGKNKVPRLMNDRRVVESLLAGVEPKKKIE